MYNPCALFNEKILDRLITVGEPFLVRQFYPRGAMDNEQPPRQPFLFTPYKSAALAQVHLAAIQADRFAKLYDAGMPDDLTRLWLAARQPAGYRCFVGIFRNNYQDGLDQALNARIKRYVHDVLHWTVAKRDGLAVTFDLHFGELYVEFKTANRTKRVKFTELENPI